MSAPLLQIRVLSGPRERARVRDAGSCASPVRKGRRCAARCARPGRAALDRRASPRWLAMRVARTRNPRLSRAFLRWSSWLHDDSTAVGGQRAETLRPRSRGRPLATDALSPDPRKQQKVRIFGGTGRAWWAGGPSWSVVGGARLFA